MCMLCSVPVLSPMAPEPIYPFKPMSTECQVPPWELRMQRSRTGMVPALLRLRLILAEHKTGQ